MTSSSGELFQFMSPGWPSAFCIKIIMESCSTCDIYASTFLWCSHGTKNMYNWAGGVSRSDRTCIMQFDLMCLPILNLRVLRPLQTPLRLQTPARTGLVLLVMLWAKCSAHPFDLLTSAQRKRGSTSREYPQRDKNFPKSSSGWCLATSTTSESVPALNYCGCSR